jgi:hypothetical protein
MGKRILVFNIVYYAVTLYLVNLGREDASASLGYGFFIVGFWIIAAIVLVFFRVKKFILPKSILERIGVFTATPVLSFAAIGLMISVQEKASSEYHFNKDGSRYKALTFQYKNTVNVERIEYYRSQDGANAAWVKDSTWLYFSEAGDTLKKIRYKNDRESD